jgi:CRISPR/Cas system-associated exonuclease Cas4 (RecB family)
MINNSFINFLTLSWSGFELYQQCPFKFYQKYALKKSEPTNIMAFYGIAFHVLLDIIYKKENFSSKYAYSIWKDVIQKEYISKNKGIYREITQDQVDKIHYLGFTHIKNFFQLASSENLLKPAVFTEQTLWGKYKNNKLVAKIDCGIQTKYGTTLLDWKSGKKDNKHIAQLVLYAALYQKKTETKIDAIASVYVKDKIICYREITQELKNKVGKYIGDIYNKIITDIEFKPKKNEYCKNCYLKKEKICIN